MVFRKVLLDCRCWEGLSIQSDPSLSLSLSLSLSVCVCVCVCVRLVASWCIGQSLPCFRRSKRTETRRKRGRRRNYNTSFPRTLSPPSPSTFSSCRFSTSNYSNFSSPVLCIFMSTLKKNKISVFLIHTKKKKNLDSLCVYQTEQSFVTNKLKHLNAVTLYIILYNLLQSETQL